LRLVSVDGSTVALGLGRVAPSDDTVMPHRWVYYRETGLSLTVVHDEFDAQSALQSVPPPEDVATRDWSAGCGARCISASRWPSPRRG
jgi:hypothetical protein